jgi:hypothetical protein
MEKHIKVHITYIIGILIAIIVGLITVKWGNIPNLVELFSFALTISSIILAILAIAYAVYSNTSFGKNIAVLDKASDDIGNSTKYLEEISNDIHDKFNDLPELLKTLHQKTDSNQSILNDLSKQRLEQKSAITKLDDVIEGDYIKTIVTNSSISGLYTLYVLKLAREAKKKFTYQDVTEKMKLNADFFRGVLAPIQALGLTKLDVSFNTDGITWQVTDLHTDIDNNVIRSVKDLWNEHQGEEHMEFVLDGINDIRVFFDLPPMSKDKTFD